MSFANYYKKFVYNVNFAATKKVKYDEIINQGNTIVNIKEAYPNGKFVEYLLSRHEEIQSNGLEFAAAGV